MRLEDITTAFNELAQSQEWQRFHTPKNLAMAASVEMGELLEHFQWLNDAEAQALSGQAETVTAVGDEIADVLMYLLALADALEIDIEQALAAKMKANRQRFDDQ